jgi:hypothetical protein
MRSQSALAVPALLLVSLATTAAFAPGLPTRARGGAAAACLRVSEARLGGAHGGMNLRGRSLRASALLGIAMVGDGAGGFDAEGAADVIMGDMQKATPKPCTLKLQP